MAVELDWRLARASFTRLVHDVYLEAKLPNDVSAAEFQQRLKDRTNQVRNFHFDPKTRHVQAIVSLMGFRIMRECLLMPLANMKEMTRLRKVNLFDPIRFGLHSYFNRHHKPPATILPTP